MYSRSPTGGRRTRPAHRARRTPVLLILITMAMVCSMSAPSIPPADVPLPTTGGGVPWSPDDVGPASPGPDLNASSDDISLSDTAPRQGQSITVGLTVRNTGDEHAHNVTVDVYDGDDATGTLIASFHIDNASSGSSTVLNTVWTAVLGSHNITMYLDVDDNVTEDSEVNNEASSTVVVSGVPDVGLVSGAFLISTNQAGSVTLTADGFNTGNATATGYRVGFYEGDPDSGGSLIGTMDLSDIPAGDRSTATTTFTAIEGEYHLYARLEKTDPLDPAGNHKVDRKVWINGAIVSRAGPDQVVMAGQNVNFNGSDSWSIDGAITNYTWDFGDSTTGYGATVTHNYTNPGTSARIVNVRLTVRDGSGRSTSDTAKVYVNPTGSTGPTADAGTAPAGDTLEELTFDGSGSIGNISSYRWDFGDGTTTTGSSVTHSYWEDGSYTVSLVVMDNASLADGDTITVDVTNQAPVVEPIGDIYTEIGVAHDLLVLAHDEDGSIASYLWDFDDGSTATSRDPSHTWYSDGSHLVSVNVTDNDGDFTLMNFYVNVTDIAPIANFTILESALEAESNNVRADASPTVEPGNDISLYEWDWDSDGTYDNTTGPVTWTYFDRPGFYNITLRVTDGEGSTNKTSREIEIIDVAPTARATRSSNAIDEGENITFNASTSSEPGGHIVQYMWDFDGDNVFEYNTTEVEVTKTFTDVGTFSPRLQVRDEDGSLSNVYGGWWIRYTVSNLPPLVNDSYTSGQEGDMIIVHVDAYEPGNNLVDFYWDFDLDGIVDAHTNVPYANHTWWSAGNFEVWVNVTDTEHMNPSPSWGAGLLDVNVTDVAPKPYVGDGQAVEGEPTGFTVELRGTEENISTYYFDLDGDGEFEVMSKVSTPDLVFTSRGANGNVNCTVRVVDTDGSSGDAKFYVFVHDVAPVVTGPEFILTIEGNTMRVEVESFEPGMDLVRYEFDWTGDSAPDNTSTEPWAEHIYKIPGAKRLVVTAVDEDGSSGSVEIQVLVANRPPTAEISTPSLGLEGEPVTLSAEESSEPGGHIVLYEWDYDGDGLFDFATREPVHSHAWDVPGNYSVILRVTDSDGTFDEDWVPVNIGDVDPVAGLEVTINPEDRPSVLDASSSSDPGGISRYIWNITSANQRLDLETTDPVLYFTFDRRVDYQISLAVYDDPGEGGMAQITRTIVADEIKSIPPEVTWDVPSSVLEGAPVVFRAWAEDPFPDDPGLVEGRIITYTWQFGDGTWANGAEVTHIYQRASATPFTVMLTVVDEDDDQTGPLTQNITVINLPPIISPPDPIIVKSGSRGETTISAEDVTSVDEGLTYLLATNSPDWASMEGNKLVVKPGDDVDPATYIITVRVIDVLDAESQTQVPVVITSDDTASGISWVQFLAVLIPLLIIVLVVAVLISRRMGPSSSGPSKDDAAGGSEYDNLYGEPTRKVRAVSKVDTERVNVDIEPTEEGEPYYPPPAEAPTEVPEPPAYVTEPVEEGPTPMPSWMSPSEPEVAEEVKLSEREVEAPPAAPPEWDRPEEPSSDAPYKFRGAKPEEGAKYRGAGPPK